MLQFFCYFDLKSEAVYFIYDGTVSQGPELTITPDSRGLKFGDGLFETLLVTSGRLLLWPYHLDRLREGLERLQFVVPPELGPGLEKQIAHLCALNGCSGLARVRITVFRGDGNLFESMAENFHLLIQATPVSPESLAFDKTGVTIGISREAFKSADGLSHLKTNHYLPSIMAARLAAREGWDDALVLNGSGRVAESAISNIFMVKEKRLYTPPLSEGCVAGVMRRHLLEVLPASGLEVTETVLTPEALLGADELFLTNAIRWIRPVRYFQQKEYAITRSPVLYDLVARSLA